MNRFHLSRFGLFFWLALLTIFLVGSGYYHREEQIPEPAQTVRVFLADLPPAERTSWQDLSASDSLYFLENCLDLTE